MKKREGKRELPFYEAVAPEEGTLDTEILDFREGRFVAECGEKVPPEEVYAEDVNGVAVYWHRYTECQKMVLWQVCRLLERCYPIRYIVGHSDVTSRKQDPGPELREFMRY